MKLKLSRRETHTPVAPTTGPAIQEAKAAHAYLRGVLNYSLSAGAFLVEFYYAQSELPDWESWKLMGWEAPSPKDREELKALIKPFVVLVYYPAKPYEALALDVPASFIKWIKLHLIHYLGLN